MKIYRPLWNEGALLSPQQFQQQTEWESFRSAGASALASPFPWGVEKIEFNDSLLSSGLIQITQLRLWLEDGSLIDAQRSDLPPAPRELDASQLTGRDAVTVVIALPHMQPGISNVEQEGVSSERPLRYREEWVTLQDAFGSEEESIAVARFNFTIRFAHESNDSWKVCPVARLIRDGQNAWRQDLSFIPPVASFGASPVLHERLMLLNRQLRSRRQRLMTMRRESNERLADFAVADVSLFWLLNALNSHATVLAEYERFPSRPPEQVWAELARLAGSMLTFSLDHDLDAIPGYDHEEPAKAFPPLCELARKCLCECAKDIRVVTWYVQARLSRDGEKGLAEGLLLLVAMLTRYGQACHPQRPVARKAALEWLNSAKVIDALLLWPEVDRNDAGLTAGAINLLQSAVADWPEAEKPSFAGLCTALENRLARSGGMEALVPQNSSAQDHGREPAHSDSPQLSAVKSGRDLLDQAKLLSRWLSEQPQGWLASHRLIKTVRWDTVNQIPPLDSSGRTRLVPPKPEYRAQLKRLYLQKNWTELVEQASQMYCEGVNHFWFDLQWYLWQGLSHAGQPWDTWTDSVLCDLRLLLKRLPGLEGLAWNDGTPFADEVTTAWIAEKVNEEGLMYGDELATVVNGPADDVLLLESEAMEKGDTEGPEAALTWLQSRPGMDTPRHRWLIRLLMARVAEQYGRNEMALHLLGELTICAPQLTLGDWEPGLLFEIHARRLKLLRLKAGRSESDKARLMPEMESLIAGLIAIDPARAMVLCG